MSHSSSSSNNSGSSNAGSDQSRRPTLPSLIHVFPEHFRPGSAQPAHSHSGQYGIQSTQPAASSSTQQRASYDPSRGQHAYPAAVAAPHGHPYPQMGIPPRPSSAVPPPGYPGGAPRQLAASATPHQYGVHRMNPAGLETLRTHGQPINHYKPEGPEKPKPHACPECGATFERPSAVQIHLRTHTGEKPFLCPYCGKTYPSSTNRNRHIRQVHGEETAESSGGGARPRA